jgi:hypothetical protein
MIPATPEPKIPENGPEPEFRPEFFWNFEPRLQGAGLKVNARKCFWGTNETKYLGYILTRDGIKPQPKKIEAILAVKPPLTVKELRRFLGLVQYYRDLWAKRSEMLATLTNLVGECGYSKSDKKLGKKKIPWHWDEEQQNLCRPIAFITQSFYIRKRCMNAELD